MAANFELSAETIEFSVTIRQLQLIKQIKACQPLQRTSIN